MCSPVPCCATVFHESDHVHRLTGAVIRLHVCKPEFSRDGSKSVRVCLYHAFTVSGEFVVPRMRRVLDHRAAGRWTGRLTAYTERRFFKANTSVSKQALCFAWAESPNVGLLSGAIAAHCMNGTCSRYEHFVYFAFISSICVQSNLINSNTGHSRISESYL